MCHAELKSYYFTISNSWICSWWRDRPITLMTFANFCHVTAGSVEERAGDWLVSGGGEHGSSVNQHLWPRRDCNTHCLRGGLQGGQGQPSVFNILNSTKYRKTKLLWFSRLLWHSATKRDPWAYSTTLLSPHAPGSVCDFRRLTASYLESSSSLSVHALPRSARTYSTLSLLFTLS